MNQTNRHLPAEIITSQYVEDEINLVEIWLLIKKRKNIILYSILFFTLLSTLFALKKEDRYQYKTTIEIGSKIVNGESKKIESPETVLAKLNESYIPLILSEYIQANDPEYKNKLSVKAYVPKNSEIIVLEAVGTDAESEVYLPLLNQVTAKINQDHQRIVRVVIKGVDVKINYLLNSVLEKKDEVALLAVSLKRQDKVADLIQQEIKNTDNILSSALKNKQKAVTEVKNESKALALMLLNSEIRKAQEMSARLKEKLYVDIVEKKDALSKKIRDVKRSIDALYDKESQLVLEKESVKETSAIVKPMRSLDKVGVGKKFIIIIGFLVGLFVGLILVFISEFSRKARELEDGVVK